MKKYFLSTQAHADVEEIVSYIAEDNYEAAERTLEKFRSKFQRLAEFPMTGSPRPELGAELRSLAVGAYIIFYRPRVFGVEILRVLHGNRDLASEFEP